MNDELLKKYNKIKYFKLIVALTIDLVGITTYFIPFLGESGDLLWAPISGLLIFALFPNRKKMAIAGAIEELLPFTDVIPTAFLTWRLDYVRDKDRTLSEFVQNEFFEEQLVRDAQNKQSIESQKFLK